jgi:hypothetical protein
MEQYRGLGMGTRPFPAASPANGEDIHEGIGAHGDILDDDDDDNVEGFFAAAADDDMSTVPSSQHAAQSVL